MKRDMEPVPPELAELYAKDPAVAHGLTLYRMGAVPLERALIGIVLALAAEKNALRADLTRRLQLERPPLWRKL